ncbi:AraC family transcriptional regulator [Paraburkholderia tropica]|uniref:AraC family transcriptional regulator n=1 Tax=Paraburkholderia tropica TaxID=92647 RepID=UPI002AB5EDB1|nr:AraC family transcriptional regulator [Paraburkholderia tropica]
MNPHHHSPVTAPGVELRRYGAIEETDLHDFHQIVLGLDGSMEMTVGGVGERIDPCSAWLIPAGARHDYAGIGENRQLVLDLPAASLAVPERLFDTARAVRIDPALAALVRQIAQRAVLAGASYLSASSSVSLDTPPVSGSSSPGDDLRARRFHWDASARLCAAVLSQTGIAGNSAFDAAAGLDFARIDRWLRAHLAQPLRIADLAAHCGFGMRRFHQLFIEAFGETPHRYLQRLRLDTAVTLLADPRHSLTDIALEVGFGDQSAFTHAFTRRFGLAPGQWRALPH